MRRTAARHNRWGIAAHRIGRLLGAVIGDDRRRIVVGTEVETGAGILLDIDFVSQPSGLPPRTFAFGSRILDFAWHRAATANLGFGMRHRKARNLAGDRPALRLIGIEDGGLRPAIEMRGKQPGQVHRIRDPRVHAVTGIGHPDMRRIAGNKRAAVAKLAGDQPTPVPVFLGEYLVFEILTHAEDGPDAGIAIHRIEIALPRFHVVVHQPSLAAIDGIDHPGTARVDDAGAPGALVMLTMDEVGSADISRLHTLYDGIAGQLGADRLADDGPRAVAADQIAAAQAPRCPRFEIAQPNARRIILDPDLLGRGPAVDADARLAGGVLEQNGLEENLVDAMRRLRRRPVAVRAIIAGEAITAAGNRNSCQFPPGKRRAVTDVVR